MFMVIENDDDREFIAALYESKRKLWVRKAYALTQDWQTAEDMVSDSFVKLIDKIELLRSLNCYKADAYVVITIENTCKTYLSQNAKHRSNVDYYAEAGMEQLKSDFSTEKAVLDKLDLELAKSAIEKLDEFEKDFIVKSFFERLDDHEISKQTGMKYNNIRTYRCRLINKIKKMCKKESEEKING